MTDFRARGTIMGLAGLTAVFGMGTGGAPPVWSPESGRGTVKPPGRVMIRGRDTFSLLWVVGRGSPATSTVGDGIDRGDSDLSIGAGRDRVRVPARAVGGVPSAAGRGGQAVRLLGPVGCGGRPPCTPGLSTWSSSRSLQG
jgi:hypothetical protein